MAEPSSALFPEPYGPAVPVETQPTRLTPETYLKEFAHFNIPLGVVLLCLVAYTRLVRGEPLNPLKWVGWRRRSRK